MNNTYKKHKNKFKDRDAQGNQYKNTEGFNMSKKEKSGDSNENLKQELKKDLDKNNMTTLIAKAEKVAKATSSKTNQIRRIYSSVIKIQERLRSSQVRSSQEGENQSWRRDLSMLKPRVVYASAKEKTLKNLKDHIIAFIDLIEEERKNQTHNNKTGHTKDKTIGEKKMTECFFCFMEAVVAYHKEKSV